MPESNTVLLVMDYQQALVERLANESLVAAVNRAIAAAREKEYRSCLFGSRFDPAFPRSLPATESSEASLRAVMRCHQDNAATQIYEGLHPLDTETVVLKRRVSAFSGSDLDILLRAAKAENLVLAGIATSGVVLSTVRQAADLDFGSRSWKTHAPILTLKSTNS